MSNTPDVEIREHAADHCDLDLMNLLSRLPRDDEDAELAAAAAAAASQARHGGGRIAAGSRNGNVASTGGAFGAKETPTKDPMGDFASWVRSQTPAACRDSRGATPTNAVFALAAGGGPAFALPSSGSAGGLSLSSGGSGNSGAAAAGMTQHMSMATPPRFALATGPASGPRFASLERVAASGHASGGRGGGFQSNGGGGGFAPFGSSSGGGDLSGRALLPPTPPLVSGPSFPSFGEVAGGGSSGRYSAGGASSPPLPHQAGIGPLSNGSGSFPLFGGTHGAFLSTEDLASAGSHAYAGSAFAAAGMGHSPAHRHGTSTPLGVAGGNGGGSGVVRALATPHAVRTPPMSHHPPPSSAVTAAAAAAVAAAMGTERTPPAMAPPSGGVPSVGALQGSPLAPCGLSGGGNGSGSAGATPGPMMSFASLRGRVVEAAKDQGACRCLQRVLDLPFDHSDVRDLVAEIFAFIPELMADPYGNFLVQKLFEVAPDEERLELTRCVAGHLPTIATTPHGTFAVQRMVESLRSAEEEALCACGLGTDVPLLMTDLHGAHVVQKVLVCWRADARQFLYDGICRDMAFVCNHKQGCVVVQRCIEHASPPQHQKVVCAVMASLFELATNPFGNYVVQCIVDRSGSAIVDKIAVLLANPSSFVALCSNKFSSNVIEKVFRACSAMVAGQWLLLMSTPEILRALSMDAYGNYVLQTALACAPLPCLEALVRGLQPLMATVRLQPYGRKMEVKFDEAVVRLRHSVPPSPMPQSPPTTHGGNINHANYVRDGSSPIRQMQAVQNNNSNGTSTPVPSNHRGVSIPQRSPLQTFSGHAGPNGGGNGDQHHHNAFLSEAQLHQLQQQQLTLSPGGGGGGHGTPNRQLSYSAIPFHPSMQRYSPATGSRGAQ